MTARTGPVSREEDRPRSASCTPALDENNGSSAELRVRAELADPLHVLHLVLDRLDALEARHGQRYASRTPAAEIAGATDSWKPTVIMGKVWQALEDSTAPLTATALASLVHSDKPRLVKEAITRLIAEGFIAETGKRPKTLRIVKPYTDFSKRLEQIWMAIDEARAPLNRTEIMQLAGLLGIGAEFEYLAREGFLSASVHPIRNSALPVRLYSTARPYTRPLDDVVAELVGRVAAIEAAQ